MEPVVYTGDVMGCGILFPRDYRRDWDEVDDPAVAAAAGGDAVNGEADAEAELGAGDVGFSSSESEDEQWWERPNPDNGTKVQVQNWPMMLVLSVAVTLHYCKTLNVCVP